MKLDDRELIRKVSVFGIINHWMLSVSCILLALSGFGFLYKIESIGALFGGFPLMKVIHNLLGIVFTFSLIMSMFNWLKESLSFDKDDLAWIMVAGGYLSHSVKVPPMHMLNTGQKIIYLAVLGMGFGTIATGLWIWLAPANQGLLVLSHFFHNLCFIGFVMYIPVHAYLCTLANPGTLRVMLYGTVPVWWAKGKSPKWVHELEERNPR